MPVPPTIAELIERFDRNRSAYYSQHYNEAQLRSEFLDPLFNSLGWDMRNVAGYAEPYKDVVVESRIRTAGGTKAPDYAFRIGGVRKFFVEAKRPSVRIQTDRDSAYQLRRYAWSAKLPLSILTNFAEFAVYDCRIEPKQTDSPAVARLTYLTHREYDSRWEAVNGIFSKEAILRGLLDQFTERQGTKRGTAEVDDAFLAEMQQWRQALAQNLAMRNPHLSIPELNYAVQQTIDRIVFLRICEDRGIEAYGELQSLLNAPRIYRRLNDTLYQRADQRYNSGLFHFRKEAGRSEAPDRLTTHLELEDHVLRHIIDRLYYPESPYEFSVLPADILGQVYEQFIGQVISLTPDHQAVIEDKPEVRRAAGVYYTPTHVVEYIVDQTLGRALEGKTVRQASSLRIVDPACGSGSFLLVAYQYLLDWHLRQYLLEPARHKSRLRPVTGGFVLSTRERKRILLRRGHRFTGCRGDEIVASPQGAGGRE